MAENEQVIDVPMQVAMQVKVLEFDKAISEAEIQVATLKAQRAKFLYDSNLNLVQQQYKKPAEQS
jgi:hypothetical protein